MDEMKEEQDKEELWGSKKKENIFSKEEINE
jgi:hypothetical protein